MVDFGRDRLFAVEGCSEEGAVTGEEYNFIAGAEAENGVELFEFFFGQRNGFCGIEVGDLHERAGEGSEGDH